MPEKSAEDQLKEIKEENKRLEEEKKRLEQQVQDLGKRIIISHPFSGKRVRIGVISDSHKGSLYENQHLEDTLIAYFNKKGAEAVYHCGDICDGEKMYRGHEYEIHVHGADLQIEHTIDTFPLVKSKMYFIIGNHDRSFWKNAGVDIGKQLESRRDDFEYLGQDQAIIEIRPNVRIMLVHPDGGTAYAVSYKSQKIVESLSGGEKPNILLIGHYHKYDHIFYRNVQTFQVPTTQSQTPYMKRKPTPAIMGGLMLDLYMDNNGLSKLTTEYIPYYEPELKS